jgi:hypothetical protein
LLAPGIVLFLELFLELLLELDLHLYAPSEQPGSWSQSAGGRPAGLPMNCRGLVVAGGWTGGTGPHKMRG